MGLFKALLLIGGVPVRPTTKRERFQREVPRLLEETAELHAQQLEAMQTFMDRQLGASNSPIPPIASGIGAGHKAFAYEEAMDLISRMHDLFVSGILSEDEYLREKNRILSEI